MAHKKRKWGENEGIGIFYVHSQQLCKEGLLKREGNRTKWKGLLVKGRKNFNLHTTRCTIGQPFSHHGDQVETLGKGLEGMKKRVERKCREQEHSKTMR